MKIYEKADYLFEKFQSDYDNWRCNDEKYLPTENCIENRLTTLLNKYNPIEVEVRNLYSNKCLDYDERMKNN